VECFYDVESQVVYIHHKCMYDTYRLSVQCQRLLDQEVDQVNITWRDKNGCGGVLGDTSVCMIHTDYPYSVKDFLIKQLIR
jgi:hypothetical protein